MLQIGVIGGLCAVWLSRRERKGWKLKPLIEELREEQKWTKQRVFQWHVSLCAVDAAVSAVLELGFLATRESVCRNCASHGHGPTTAYYYYHTSVGKASKICEMFMTVMPACPGVLFANSILYSTKEALKKLAWHVLFAFSHLELFPDITPLITFSH